MKQIIILTLLFVGLANFSEAKSYKQITYYNSFYSHLSPYGVWMEFDDGLVVWRPTIMRRGWAPYSTGRWIWTDYGWYWDSYESFGYITYHYGRWYYDDYYGWLWVPDYDWAPAWVEWRYDDSYIGWAPLPPYAAFSINIGIHFSYNYVSPYAHWHFVNYNRMCDPYVYKYYVAPKYKYRIYSNTKYRNDYGYHNGRAVNRGIDISDVRSRSGQDIRQRSLQQISDPRELTNGNKSKSSQMDFNSVKTYILSREELSRESDRNVDIRKTERNSSIETYRIQLGDRKIDSPNREDNSRNIERNKETRENTIETNRSVTRETKDIGIRKKDNSIENNRKQIDNRIDIRNKDAESRTNSERMKNENRNPNSNKQRVDEKASQIDRNFQIQREQKEIKMQKKLEPERSTNPSSNRNDEQRKSFNQGKDQRVKQESRSVERTRNR